MPKTESRYTFLLLFSLVSCCRLVTAKRLPGLGSSNGFRTITMLGGLPLALEDLTVVRFGTLRERGRGVSPSTISRRLLLASTSGPRFSEGERCWLMEFKVVLPVRGRWQLTDSRVEQAGGCPCLIMVPELATTNFAENGDLEANSNLEGFATLSDRCHLSLWLI